MMKISLTLNGKPVTVDVEPRTSLADLLRSPGCGCTSIHLGCEHGVCGACTILIDGRIARSCIALAVACDGAEVTTLEGLGEDELTTQLKDAFHCNHGLQCGFCTPGMLISAREVVARNPQLSEEELRTAMSGNICRCTGYTGIVAAVSAVAASRASSCTSES
ncbi:(2Fe-2S)-binding protein [Aquamicrobium terrae]|uniref:Carbon-monoxide dehydrogenase small subunit n=1 Tax=Aquamicrobium terrae TaxID=1324945 RepID=A0ABV2N7L2_9HYPH